MKLLVTGLVLITLVCSPGPLFAQLASHKSAAEVMRMPAQQRVEEYRKELLLHGYGDDYEVLLSEFLRRDGLKAVPYLVKIIAEYDPTQSRGRSRERDVACYGAEGVLSQIDENTVRLRGTEEGKKAIDALRQLVDGMRTAHFDTAEGDKYDEQMRYKGTLAHLSHLEGISWLDTAIKDTLELRKNIKLSAKEMLAFVNYLVSQDPYYPSQSRRERYKDFAKINEAGNPLQFVIVKDIEPFYKLYLEYKAKSK
jgi:hypothetical protein